MSVEDESQCLLHLHLSAGGVWSDGHTAVNTLLDTASLGSPRSGEVIKHHGPAVETSWREKLSVKQIEEREQQQCFVQVINDRVRE